ncbi:MAG TPA: hypothetical protein VFR23_19430 [Jiangellaceae bacterium]|nr:hypothetical protein [Jiangellaceae bacterium]
MSIEHYIVIRCDYPGKCADRFSYDTVKVSEARAAAKKSGWAYGRRKDYCPRHREYAGGEPL